MAVSIADRRAAFRRLHESGCFVIPNPWDAGSAVWLQQAGFKALASTSSGYAWTLGLADNGVGLEGMLAHLKALVAATEIPVNADFENAYADEPQGVAANVLRAAEAGVAGLSVEDSTGRSDKPLYDFDQAVARVTAARQALDKSGSGVLLTARAECFLVGHADPLAESIRRLKAYAAAGADCLYAPGLKTPEQIKAVVTAVAPKPVNVLMGGPGLTVPELAALGVRRVSTGGALARAAWQGFIQTAKEIADAGSFESLGKAISFGELDGFFRKRKAKGS
ncbi:MAG TPA: isocitrate lyase/phosphoenolpyruvate mutase family protein [Dongiaceae bacterium]